MAKEPLIINEYMIKAMTEKDYQDHHKLLDSIRKVDKYIQTKRELLQKQKKEFHPEQDTALVAALAKIQAVKSRLLNKYRGWSDAEANFKLEQEDPVAFNIKRRDLKRYAELYEKSQEQGHKLNEADQAFMKECEVNYKDFRGGELKNLKLDKALDAISEGIDSVSSVVGAEKHGKILKAIFGVFKNLFKEAREAFLIKKANKIEYIDIIHFDKNKQEWIMSRSMISVPQKTKQQKDQIRNRTKFELSDQDIDQSKIHEGDDTTALTYIERFKGYYNYAERQRLYAGPTKIADDCVLSTDHKQSKLLLEKLNKNNKYIDEIGTLSQDPIIKNNTKTMS